MYVKNRKIIESLWGSPCNYFQRYTRSGYFKSICSTASHSVFAGFVDLFCFSIS